MLLTYLAEWFDRIVSKIKGMAPVLFAFGCQNGTIEGSTTVAPPPPPPAISSGVLAEPVAAPASDIEPKPLGKFTITFYYVVTEDELAKPANDNRDRDPEAPEVELASVTPADRVTLYEERSCQPIAEVSREFAHQLRVQGTGLLRDGRILNIWSRCKCKHTPCFRVMPQQWGTSGSGRPLQPFRTVAVDPTVVKLGSLLYVPELEGRMMPGRAPWGGYVHDGCVVADDTGGNIKDRQLDLFVGRRGWFLGMSKHRTASAWAHEVPVFDGAKRCERQGRRVARKAGAI